MSKTMLIIEDDAVSRDLLRLIFDYEGFHCVEAENGKEGLAILESQQIDIIILDNGMPVMTGLQFLKHLQQNKQHAVAPIIMMTGLLTSKVREQAEKLGAYAILSKPFDVGEIRALANMLCRTKAPFRHKPTLVPR